MSTTNTAQPIPLHTHDQAWFDHAPVPPLSIWESVATCKSRWCSRCQEYRKLNEPVQS